MAGAAVVAQGRRHGARGGLPAPLLSAGRAPAPGSAGPGEAARGVLREALEGSGGAAGRASGEGRARRWAPSRRGGAGAGRALSPRRGGGKFPAGPGAPPAPAGRGAARQAPGPLLTASETKRKGDNDSRSGLGVC